MINQVKCMLSSVTPSCIDTADHQCTRLFVTIITVRAPCIERHLSLSIYNDPKNIVMHDISYSTGPIV